MTKNARYTTSVLRNFLWSSIAACLLQALTFVPTVCAQENPPADSRIHVEITGLRNDQGKVLCSLYSSWEGFPKKAEKAIARTSSEISDRRAVCQFTGLGPGTYAVSAFHDENSNGKLDTKFMGIPREGVGASNNAKRVDGVTPGGLPSFSDITASKRREDLLKETQGQLAEAKRRLQELRSAPPWPALKIRLNP